MSASIVPPSHLHAVLTLCPEQIGAALQSSGQPDPLDLAFGHAFCALLRGEALEAAERAAGVERDAAHAGRAARVIEAAALRALALATASDLEGARATARRASRMARTEAIAEAEWFAHLILARVRRLSGFPHLATHILRSLEPRAARPYRPWIELEMLMAGHRSAPSPVGQAPVPQHGANLAHVVAHTLDGLLRAVSQGDRAGVQRLSKGLEQAAAPAAFVLADVSGVLDALDPLREPGTETAPFLHGRNHQPPPSLHGLLALEGEGPLANGPPTFVLGHPDRPGRRIPRAAFGLIDLPSLLVLPHGKRGQRRSESVVSALALAQAGELREAELFESVYGFAYEADRHRGALGVCLHRARGYLAQAGSLQHRAGVVSLGLQRTILVPDPRWDASTQDRLLCVIAERRAATPGQAAAALGLSLRVAQKALAELAAEGACVVSKDGRELRYEVEDTTFAEPTTPAHPPG